MIISRVSKGWRTGIKYLYRCHSILLAFLGKIYSRILFSKIQQYRKGEQYVDESWVST
jgi:hypothetical protein